MFEEFASIAFEQLAAYLGTGGVDADASSAGLPAAELLDATVTLRAGAMGRIIPATAADVKTGVGGVP